MKKLYMKLLSALLAAVLLTTLVPAALMEESDAPAEIIDEVVSEADSIDFDADIGDDLTPETGDVSEEHDQPELPADEDSGNISIDEAVSEADSIDFDADTGDGMTPETGDVSEEHNQPELPTYEASGDISIDEAVSETDSVGFDADTGDDLLLEAEYVSEKYYQSEPSTYEASGDIPIDEAHFPDPAFRQYVMDHFSGPSGVLPQQTREGVETLGGMGIFYQVQGEGNLVWSLNITSLKGIEYFPNLKSIDCCYQPIGSLDVSNFKKLDTLRCLWCNLTSLNVSGCDALYQLWAAHNAFTSLDVSNCALMAGFPTGYKINKEFIKKRGDQGGYIVYRKKLAGRTYTLLSGEVVDSYIDIYADKNVTVTGTGGTAASGSVAAVPASFTEVEGATNATVTVAAGSTAKKTTATVVAAPGTVTQLNFGGATAKKLKSSNKKIATVNSAGVVTFKKAGKVKITYKVGKKTRAVVLKIIDPTVPTSIALDQSGTVAAKAGESVTLTATMNEGAVSGIKWKSSNKKVATVKNGVVTFKKKGKATITAKTKRGKKKAKVKFTVSK